VQVPAKADHVNLSARRERQAEKPLFRALFALRQKQRDADHACEHCHAHGVTHFGARTGEEYQRRGARDEGK
jgi:hypothetical protein